MATALYAGSFNPFTTGHLSIVERALGMFDRVIIGVGFNENKPEATSAEERAASIRNIFSDNSRVDVAVYSGLTVDFARQAGADVLLRGARDGRDFDAEKTLADTNRAISGMETVIIPTLPELSFVSSSMVRELLHNRHDVSEFLPSSDHNAKSE